MISTECLHEVVLMTAVALAPTLPERAATSKNGKEGRLGARSPYRDSADEDPVDWPPKGRREVPRDRR